MQRIAVVVATLFLLATGAAIAGTKPSADCTCQAPRAQSSGLGAVELSP